MAVPFGFSVGDFLAVSKLIGQIVVELGEIGRAAPEYQSILIELEALRRALRSLQTLRPAKHELLQLTSIRATALACQRPLQDFFDKISKFESRLGTFNTGDNRWKGLPRRMQFRIMFKEDVKQLRSTMASHVTTINILLMTQTVASISAAEEDRNCLASGLESKILEHRQLLEDVSGRVDHSMEQQKDIKTRLYDQSSVLDDLGKKTDENYRQLNSQEASIEKILTVANRTQTQTKSILTMTTEVLYLITSGLMHLRQMADQLHIMIRVCATFTEEMRAFMSKLMELFLGLQTMLQRIENNLPARLYLPTVQFTTALGETMALPYQLCQQWTTFTELLRVIFLEKPGETRVDMGKFLIINARSGRLLEKRSWQHTIQQKDHLSMSIVLDELEGRAGVCPFPTCQASTEGVEIVNGGRTCRKCDRWSLLAPQKRGMLLDVWSSKVSSKIEPRETKMPIDEEAIYNDTDSDSFSDSMIGQTVGNEEDIELYRQIHVQYFSTASRAMPRHFGTALSHRFKEGRDLQSEKIERSMMRGYEFEVPKMEWFVTMGERISAGQIISVGFRDVVQVRTGVPAYKACASTVRIYACETTIPPLYRDDPTVSKFAELTLDLRGFTIPTIRIGAERFYEIEFSIEITLAADSLLIYAVYDKDTAHANRLVSEYVQLA